MPASHARGSRPIPGTGRAGARGALRPPPQRLLLTATLALAAALSAGCGKSSPDVAESGAKGVYGSSFVVTVSRPQNGTVTSGDRQINCGTTASACTATYPWSTIVVLTATPATGYGLRTWAGDCTGIGTCVLDTKTAGADKFVMAVFDPSSSLGHPNWSSPPSVHGKAFLDFAGGVAGALQCTACHGSTYDGMGIAPSCNACHASSGWVGWQTNCSFCHGAKTPASQAGYAAADHPTWAAPPDDVAGRFTGSNAPNRTGAHAAHLTGITAAGASFSAPLRCSTCHLVPTSLSHIRGSTARATVVLSGVGQSLPASLGTYNPSTGTCSTYCHGPAPSPAWASTGLQCGDCHALPPAASTGHPQVSSALTGCVGCHPGTMNLDGTLKVASGKHLDGIVDVAGGGHPAGWSDPGQHGLSALSAGLDTCTACHTGFGPVANGGAKTSCDGCHADPASYGPYATGTYPPHPSWKTECTFCHGGRDSQSGAPPRDSHVISSDLTTAQGTTVATIGAHASHLGTASSAPSSTHGISTALDCTACHRTRFTSATDPGHIDATTADVVFAAVGGTANPGSYARPTCAATYCHGNFPGGAGSGAVAWTGSFGASLTLGCASCHGAPPSATAHHPPNPDCGTCHPGYGATTVTAATHVDGRVQHVPATGCTQCHGDPGVAAATNADVRSAPGGDANALDAHGNLASVTSARGVGTHAKHLTSTTWRAAPLACSECHAVPAAGDTSHADGIPAVAFGPLARTAWPGQPLNTPIWLGAGGAPTLTCASTYCHGAFKNGASASPAWTAAGSVACGSCHGVSPTNGPGGTHPVFGSAQTCGSCHGGSYTNTSVDKVLHLNGVLDGASLTCSSCHGDPTRAPVASASWLDAFGSNLVKASPPGDAGHGAAATGAHLAHVNQGDTAGVGALSNAVACSNCHPVPTSTGHSDGAVSVTFAGLAAAGGAAPAPYDLAGHTCASTYCHGNFTGGAGASTISWTATGKLGCASCHGAPPSATAHHPPNPSCGSCHAGYTATTVAAASHVDGAVQHTPATGCTQCHGDLTVSGVANTDVRGAPGSDANAVDAHGSPSGATTARGVGTHAKHLTSTAWRAAPIACGECHAVPAPGDTSHANGTPAVAFGALARTAWVGQPAIAPAWNGAGGGTTLTCASTYCHGAFKNGASAAPTWTAAGSVTCGSCHGVSPANGPGGTHPALSAGQDCGSCHGGSYTNTSVDASLHLNGQVDGGGSHPQGWSDPGQHGLAALGNLDGCATCHVGFGPAVSARSSCDICHADPSAYGPYASGTYPPHPSWKTECTFCHGGRDSQSGAPPRNAHVLSSDLTTPQPTTDATIGAHTAHVGTPSSAPRSRTGLSVALDCSACHATRWASATDPGHVDAATADVVFGAVGGTANPGSYARPGCAATYCHGNFPGGAGSGAVQWTGAFGSISSLSCASCHGAPPSGAAHHPPNPNCSSCHPGYTASTVAATTHVDGAVQHAPATGCTQCHGDLTVSGVASADVRAAPAGDANAVDAHGNPSTATTARGVGAHATHLTATTWRAAPIACAECHAVPAAGDTSHANGTPAVAFGALARNAWAGQPAIAPAWNGAGGGATLTCASTYCHGAFKNGATASPTWTAAGSVTCGSCHGVSPTNGPGGTHPTIAVGQHCGSCHGGSYTNTAVDKTLHLNGQVDGGGGHPPGWSDPGQHGLAALGGLDGCATCHVGFGPANASARTSCDTCHADPGAYGPYASGAYPAHPAWKTECTFCHGGRGSLGGAPPRNTHVISSDLTTPQPTTDATIGAHASHVGTASSAPNSSHGTSIALDCTACHASRWASATDPGHVDATTAEVVFGAVGGTANPGSYARPGCAATYCHGNFPGGAGNGAVQWTGSFGASSTLGCASCHGAPPAPTSATVHHPPNPSCPSCHPGYTAGAVVAATHVDGAVQHTPAAGCTQCHGDLTVSGVASADVRAAPAGDANAVDAHGNPAAATTSRGVGTHAKHLTSTTWRAAPLACSECHVVPAAGDTSHADGTPAVAFGALARTAWSGQPAIAPAWNGAGGGTTLTCAATYCHGAFKNGATASPTWTAAGSVTCGSCHGVSPTNGPGGTHPTFGSGQTCGSCHGGAYTNASVDPALHLNGALEVANLTCSSCHGDAGRAAVASASALDALGANLVKAAPPADAGHGPAATGAHLAHVNQGDTAAPGALSNALECTTCHAVPTSTGHSDGTVAVTFAGLATAGGAAPAPYDLSNHTCASTYCHGSFTGGAGANTISWTASGKLACNACHAAPPGPTSATVHHPPNPSCGSCHAGYTATTVSVATHVDGAVQHTPATGCTQCHGDLTASGVANTDLRAAPGANPNAVDAHGNLASAATARGVGAHGKHLTSTTWRSTPIACAECHAVPDAGDTGHVTGIPTVAFGALARTAWAGQPAIAPAWNGAGGGTTLTCASTYCHGAFKNGANDVPDWTAPGSVACGSCHGVSPANGPGGSHPALTAGQSCGTCHGGSYTNASVDAALHLNGKVDGGGEPSGNSACAGCHGAIFAGMNGTVGHVTRHGLGALAGTNDSPSDSGVTWGNPLSANAAAARSCVNMCHGDHPHDLSSPATATHENDAYLDATSVGTRANGTGNRIGAGGTGGTPNRTRTDYDGAQANGGLCVSCHRNAVDAAHPAIDEAAFDVSAHDYTASTAGGTTYDWGYVLHDGGVFARNCTKCHASNAEGTTPLVSSGSATAAVHFGDNASLLSGTANPAGAAAGFVCYNCHGSAATPAAGAQGNRSGKDIQSQIAHTATAGQSGHPSNADTRHDSVAELATAAFGNALGVSAGAGQRHASCLDCHDPHEAKAGTHAVRTNVAGPPLQGAWGAELSTRPAFWSSPTSASFTKKTLVAGTDLEATLCFKCHSSFYGTLPASPSGGYTETDTAKEFNPNNAGNWATTGTANAWSTGETAGGFHPVLATAGGNLGASNLANLVTTNIAWSTTARNLMTCTDCHESDTATDPNGPHGSAAGFILRGPNTTWNGTMVATSTGMPAGAFCANCHSSTYANSRFNPSSGTHISRSAHRVACWNCHARIPHGGPRPGMLVAPAGAATGVGGTIAGWDNAAPYAQPGSGSRLYILSYPSGQGTSWQQNNCGCNGTGH